MPWYLEQISNCTYRQFTTGFYFGKPTEKTQIYDNNTYVKGYTYLGIIGEEKDGMYRIEQRNKFSVGESIEIMKPNGENIEVTVKRIVDEEGQEQESAPHPNRCFMWISDMRQSNTIFSDEGKNKESLSRILREIKKLELADFLLFSRRSAILFLQNL